MRAPALVAARRRRLRRRRPRARRVARRPGRGRSGAGRPCRPGGGRARHAQSRRPAPHRRRLAALGSSGEGATRTMTPECPQGVTPPLPWLVHVRRTGSPLASSGDAAFFIVFAIFIVAMVVLIVIVIRWAVRHDIAGRQAWRKRQEARAHGSERPPGPAVSDPASTDGAPPRRWAERLRARLSRHPDELDGSPGPLPGRTAFVLAGGGSRGRSPGGHARGAHPAAASAPTACSAPRSAPSTVPPTRETRRSRASSGWPPSGLA